MKVMSKTLHPAAILTLAVFSATVQKISHSDRNMQSTKWGSHLVHHLPVRLSVWALSRVTCFLLWWHRIDSFPCSAVSIDYSKATVPGKFGTTALLWHLRVKHEKDLMSGFFRLATRALDCHRHSWGMQLTWDSTHSLAMATCLSLKLLRQLGRTESQSSWGRKGTLEII